MAEATETFARAGRIGTNVAMDVADMPGSAYIADEIADVSPSMDEMDDVPGPVQLAAARGSLEQTLHTSRDIDLGEPIKIARNKARSSEAVFVRKTCIGHGLRDQIDKKLAMGYNLI
ncbi:hypothetical protein PANT_7d00253 [Moesziomyces antarcticus T-34]|uniref:Uncharacterized protein n=1 Tax=Pseudozyma antarctica (strain T-34) TaxID=1151754 RepID=M9MDN1_PSEA3|nr:hypothetical protein PANT_7d00253 [Moesziomyces antarcticus T-34]